MATPGPISTNAIAKIAALAILIVAMGAGVSACGRKGAPEVPPGSTYPSNYPSK